MNAIRKWLTDNRDVEAGRLFVYRFYGHDGALIYVGSSSNVVRRLRTHARRFGAEVASVVAHECESRAEMLADESAAICHLNPKYNRKGRTDLPDRRINRWGTAIEVERNRLAREMYRNSTNAEGGRCDDDDR